MLCAPFLSQFSSVGSLGKSDTWFREEFGASLSAAKNRKQCHNPKLKMVFPTVENVKERHVALYLVLKTMCIVIFVTVLDCLRFAVILMEIYLSL